MNPQRIQELLEVQQKLPSEPGYMHKVLCTHVPEALNSAADLNDWLDWFDREVDPRFKIMHPGERSASACLERMQDIWRTYPQTLAAAHKEINELKKAAK